MRLSSHVASSLKKMIKNVQVTGESIDEDDLDEAVRLGPDGDAYVAWLSFLKVARVREQHEKTSAEAPTKEVYLSIIRKPSKYAESTPG